MDEAEIDRILQEKEPKKLMGFRKRKRDSSISEVKKIIQEYKDEMMKQEAMDEEEKLHQEEERKHAKEIIKGESEASYPIIIKASTAGALETLIQEAEKMMEASHYKV